MKIQAFEFHEPLPKLRNPHVIAMLRPWLDAGNVGTLVLDRLEEYFSAQEVGRLIRPGTFFDFTRYRPQTRTIEGKRSLTIPNSTIMAVRREEPPDFLFLHLLEPHVFAEEYIDSIVEVIKLFDVKRYFRIGGMYNAVPHTRPLRVTGNFNGVALKGLPGVSSQRNAYQGPTSIMNLITDATDKLGVENVNIMVHLPQYLELEEDHAGKARLLQVLSALYDFPEDVVQLDQGDEQYREVDSAVQRNPTVKSLVRRLESYYDSRADRANGEEQNVVDKPMPLAPEVEQFLQDIGDKLDGSL